MFLLPRHIGFEAGLVDSFSGSCYHDCILTTVNFARFFHREKVWSWLKKREC